MNKIMIIMILSFSFILSISAGINENVKTVKIYKIKVFKGKWNFWSGEKECYFIRNKDLTIIKFGGTDKREWNIELEEVNNNETN